jgi:hypothetical protein
MQTFTANELFFLVFFNIFNSSRLVAVVASRFEGVKKNIAQIQKRPAEGSFGDNYVAKKA